MAVLGITNRVKINRFVDFGAFVDGGDLGEVLLPKRYVSKSSREGDIVEAFIYRDSEDRLVATTDVPFAEVGDCAYLEVVQVNNVGAFLNWGLPKDLFVPFGEQRRKMQPGEKHVVYIYVDNSGRIAASSKLRRYLDVTTDEYEEGDEVDLLVVGRNDLGYEVVVDDYVLGVVFDNDALSQLEKGTKIGGFVKKVREDGKLNLSLTSPLETRDDLGERILQHLRDSGGSSTLTDKSPPDEIFAAFGVSKRAYKKALGGLYKARQVLLIKGSVELVQDE